MFMPAAFRGEEITPAIKRMENKRLKAKPNPPFIPTFTKGDTGGFDDIKISPPTLFSEAVLQLPKAPSFLRKQESRKLPIVQTRFLLSQE